MTDRAKYVLIDSLVSLTLAAGIGFLIGVML